MAEALHISPMAFSEGVIRLIFSEREWAAVQQKLLSGEIT